MLVLKPVTIEELANTIDSLKPKPSTGVDGISAKILKVCKHELLSPLLHVVQLSLANGEFPQKLKTTRVFPLLKKGNKHETGNYRPISLIPTISKILEKIILSRILAHLNINKLLTDRQHGFVKGKSTTTALVDIFESIVDSIENGDSVMGIFVDMSKAFDCLSHNMIIDKLHNLGIRDMALRWFRSYLTNRNQVVEITQYNKGIRTTARSELQPISRGVPQGSVLGPLLFVLATNDLPAVTEPLCRAIMYADDTVLLTSQKSVENLEIDAYIGLNLAVDYCTKHDLVFNASKTKQIAFGSKRNEISTIPDIDTVTSIKYLGLHLDENLNWNEHIDSLCHKLCTAIFAIRRTVSISTEKAALTAYHALFGSLISYGVSVWGGTSTHNLQRVLILQKRALRTIKGMKMQDSCRPIFKSLKILTVVNIYILQSITLAVILGTNKRHQDVHNHRTRQVKDFNLPAHRLKLFEGKPSYAGAKFFNALPASMKSMEPIKLKKEVKSWLKDKPFYNVKEFLTWKE